MHRRAARTPSPAFCGTLHERGHSSEDQDIRFKTKTLIELRFFDADF
jgi:hypothetical protein